MLRSTLLLFVLAPLVACDGGSVPMVPPTCDGGACAPCTDCPDGGADAGEAPDAGVPDAGEAVDAGQDGGFDEDAGTDAGVDAGCTWDAGSPANVLHNPGFECGEPPEGWGPGPDSDVVADPDARNGLQAARVTATGTANPTLYPATPPIKANVSANTWCASAWLKGTSPGTARLSIQRYAYGGGVNENQFAAPLTTDWVRLHTSASTTVFDAEVTVKVSATVSEGTALLVDDIALWVSPDGSCAERP
jgi:hypothetical protein